MKNKPSIAQQLGKRGGLKTVEKYGASYMKELSQKAAEARAKKKKIKEWGYIWIYL